MDMLNEKKLRGYPKLADLMSTHPETAIFRRFGALTMLNVLRIQAELQDMEEELKDIIADDAGSNNAVRQKYCLDFRHMRDFLDSDIRGSPEEQSLQYEHIINIGNKIDEYSKAVVAATQLQQVQSPNRRQTRFLRNWLDRPDGGESFLHDREKFTWAEENTDDFMSLLSQQGQNDVFTSLLKGFLLDVYHRVWGHRKKTQPGFRDYSERKIAWTSTVIVTVLSSAMPTITVLVLFFIKSLIVRIGLVIVFTSAFSLALAVFSSADKATIFTATATFAAVEVVFVGSTSSTG